MDGYDQREGVERKRPHEDDDGLNTLKHVNCWVDDSP